MKTIEKAFVAALGVGVAALCGCARHSTKEVYYLVTANSALPYWQTAAQGFNDAAAQYQVTAKVVGPDGYDAQDELKELNQAVAAKPSGILISVADATVLEPGINAAVAAGVPVITVDSDDPASKRLFFIGTNNLEAGRMGGKRLADKLPAKANLIVFTFVGQPNTDERLKGVKDALSARPDVMIVDVIDVKGDAREAFDKAQVLLGQTGPKRIDGFICLDSASGKMVSDAIARAADKNRVLVAWDVNPDTLNGIKAGTIDATIAQKPYTMGYVGLRELAELFAYPPKQLDKDYAVDSFAIYPVFIDTGTSLVDKNNVDLYLAAAAQHNK